MFSYGLSSKEVLIQFVSFFMSLRSDLIGMDRSAEIFHLGQAHYFKRAGFWGFKSAMWVSLYCYYCVFNWSGEGWIAFFYLFLFVLNILITFFFEFFYFFQWRKKFLKFWIYFVEMDHTSVDFLTRLAICFVAWANNHN